MTVQQQRHKFTVDEVLRMAELGTMPEARVQLIDGDLIEMSPQGAEHAGLVVRLNNLLRAYPLDRFTVRPALPLRLPGADGHHTLPEPDFAVVRGSEPIPWANEAILVIEIAKSSLRLDRRKAARYVAAGVPEYWIVDVTSRQLHRYGGLVEGMYTVISVATHVTLPEIDQRFAVEDLFR